MSGDVVLRVERMRPEGKRPTSRITAELRQEQVYISRRTVTRLFGQWASRS